MDGVGAGVDSSTSCDRVRPAAPAIAPAGAARALG